jgi:hypothetical protein
MLLLFGVTLPAQVRQEQPDPQEKRGQEAKPAPAEKRQTQEDKPAPREQQQQRQQQAQQPRQNENRQQQSTQQSQQDRPDRPQRAQQSSQADRNRQQQSTQPPQQDRPDRPQRAQQSSQAERNRQQPERAARQQNHAQPVGAQGSGRSGTAVRTERSESQQRIQQSAWQQHRATNWQSDHRNWQQRGGYHGYRIPDDRFRGYFGSDHGFRIEGLPFLVVGGYPRFQYQGYWISAVDPWPEYWGNDWYDTDDVYVGYVDGGYYLYNRRYPTVGLAINISM